MAQSVILDPVAKSARLVPNSALDGHKLTGKTVIAVANDFAWAFKKVDWTAKTIVDDLDAIQLDALAALKAEAATRKMQAMTADRYKQAEYAAKRQEVIAWESLGGTLTAILAAFNLLSPAVRGLRFEYAIADAAAFSDQPADAIARFKAGMTKSGAMVPAKIAAAEAKASKAIRDGQTGTAKRNAASAVAWPS